MNPERSQSDLTVSKARNQGPNKIIFILGAILVLVFGFAIWAIVSKQSAQSQSAKKVAAALAASQQLTANNQSLTNQLKQPYKTYTGSPTFGSINFTYPKNYSAYVDDTGSDEPINGYFHPDVVPAVQSNTAFALRLELLDQSYSSVVQQYDSQVTSGKLKAAAYIPPKMVGVKNVQAGVKLDGVIGQDQNGAPQSGSVVVLTVRDKTLKIYTESNNFADDFNNVILASLTFVP